MKISIISTKILTASLTLAATTGLAFAKHYKAENYKGEAMAAPCPTMVTLMDGFYVGGQVGYDSYWVRENIDLPAPSDLTSNPKINAPGWLAGLFLGYGQYFNSFYLGGEVFGNWNQANESYFVTNASGTYSAKFEADSNYGASFLPGIKLNDTTLAYLRLGWNWANLKSNESAATSASKTNTSNGGQYGVGMETLLAGNWSVRAEYNHTNFSSFTSALGTNFDPSDNQFLVGALYHVG